MTGVEHEARIWLDPLTSSVSTARRFVEGALLRWQATEILDDAQLLTSELVTNAVLHARTTIELVLVQQNGALRIEVHDRCVIFDPAAAMESGQGLQLIEGLASGWGIARDGSENVVWLELKCPATEHPTAAATDWRTRDAREVSAAS
jgi:anti-sigma regulatory factor (Ser/Thr protein kinase)